MQTKRLILIFLAILLSHQTICHAKQQKGSKSKTNEFIPAIMPIVFGGGTFFFTPAGLDQHYPGYTLSGGLSFYANEKDLIDTMDVSIFIDALYSYRAYDGIPAELHYRIEETSLDIAAGIGLSNLYVGCYVQTPVKTMVRVSEWTIEDYDGLARKSSFSFMGGYRIVGKRLGFDARLLLGQGPGQFLRKSMGDSWLGQFSLGIMAVL